MKIKEVIKKVLTLIGYDDKVEKVGSESASVSDTKFFSTLARLCAVVLGEVAESYVPLVKKQQINKTDDLFLFSSLTYPVYKIKKVYSTDGSELQFVLHSNGIECQGETVIVEYNYLPDKYETDSIVEYDGKAISERIIAYGVASEYFAINGDYTASDIWKKKFYENVSRVFSKKGIKIKGRKWI